MAKDESSNYQLLKQVNINLAQFLDQGKLEDMINFEDVSVLFVFDLQVTQTFSS